MNDKTPKKTAVIVGAGIGGVSCAARLAQAGFSVVVCEKQQDFSGGRCSLIHYDGYRFDQGPSLLLLPHLFQRTFRHLGTTMEKEGVHLLKCEPNYNIWYGDGEKVSLHSDLSKMKLEIERWEGKAGFERYLKFLQESHRHYELSVSHVLSKNFTSLLSMLRWSFLQHLLDLHPFESIYTRTSKYFWSERLRRAFTFASMYMGMSPMDAPGTYSLLQYTEFAEGIWYPIGGFHKVVEALVNIGERSGVRYRYGATVQSIVLNGSTVQGVRLADGEFLQADIVVNNSDLVYAYNELLPPSGYAESLRQREGSCSSISFYWALSGKVPELEPHNIFLADHYKESFDAIFKKHLIPDEPSFYVNVPSRIDPTAAPEGKDSLVVLVPVGHLVGEAAQHPSANASSIKDVSGKQNGIAASTTQDWPAMIALARKTILKTIESRTGADVSSLIIHEITNDPKSWQERFNLDKGSILGLSHSFFNVLCFRPTTRARRPHWLDGRLGNGLFERIVLTVVDAGRGSSKDIKGLYMVGASVHPGTGVPIVLAGANIVSDQILEDLNMPIPWQHLDQAPSKKSSLDIMHKPLWLDDSKSWIFLILAVSSIPWVLVLAHFASRLMV